MIGTARKARAARLAVGRQDRHQPGFPRCLVRRLYRPIVAGVWLGNDDGTPTKKVSGGNLPVEVWNGFMKVALKDQPPVPLPGGNRFAPAETPVAAATPRGYASAQPRESGWSQPAPQATRNLFERLFGL